MSYAQLEKVCVRCKPSSIKTYWANIKALSKVAGHADVPAGGAWLNAKLLERIKAMPLNRFKRFSTAGVKAAQMYKLKKPIWSQAMSLSTEKYARIRESGKRTEREARNWPKDGYRALSKLARDLHSEMEHLEKKKYWTTSELYHYQRYLIVLFYSKHALRGDLADVKYRKPYGPNYIRAVGKKYKLHIGEHKTSRAHGAIQLELGPEITAALNTFSPNCAGSRSMGTCSVRSGRGTGCSGRTLRLIRNTTKERLGKNIGVQLIRVLKVTGAAEQIDAAEKLQQEMGHGASMQKKYISRGGWDH